MQIVDLELTHLKFYCPATGEVILDEDAPPINENAKSLMGYWISEVLMEPTINNKSLETGWKKFVKKTEKETDGDEPEYDDIEVFMKKFKAPTWVVFAISTSGVGNGPYSSTVWLVVDMDTMKTKKGKKT